MRLHFIRHTRPDIARGVCYGQSDIPLAASFAEEAEDVRARLTERLEGRTPTRIYSSPLSRCRHLSEALGYEAPILDARLLELNFGEWELQRFDEITTHAYSSGTTTTSMWHPRGASPSPSRQHA